MTRIDFFFTARLTDPECVPRHVATVSLHTCGAVVEYLDARGLEEIDRLAVLTIPMQVDATCDIYRDDLGRAADALIAIYAHGNVWARRGNGYC